MQNHIDHTLLKPYATSYDIERLCDEAREWEFASVCVNPIFVPLAKNLLQDTTVAVGTVIDFPLGSGGVEAKAFQAVQAVSAGAQEIDMVMNISAFKKKFYSVVQDEIITVIERTRKVNPKTITKVIIETCYLSDNLEKAMATRIAAEAGAHFVKTSTGFGTGNATVDDVRLMRAAVEPRGAQVKASGGIKDMVQAVALLNVGATRIGTSSGVEIMQQYKAMENLYKEQGRH